jgi:hypothetical protein
MRSCSSNNFGCFLVARSACPLAPPVTQEFNVSNDFKNEKIKYYNIMTI